MDEQHAPPRKLGCLRSGSAASGCVRSTFPRTASTGAIAQLFENGLLANVAGVEDEVRTLQRKSASGRTSPWVSLIRPTRTGEASGVGVDERPPLSGHRAHDLRVGRVEKAAPER